MKSLSLAKPLVIMMVGLPGAGKSFFARQFAETFGAPLVSYDRLRHELFERQQFNQQEYELATRLAICQFEELLKTGKTLVYDGGCETRTNRAYIRQMACKAGYSTLAVWVQTDPATCMLRATKRSKRRAGDQLNQSLTPEQFKKIARTLSPPTREEYMVISGRHTYNTQARVVLKRLVGQRAEQAELAYKNNETVRPTPVRNAERRNVVIR